MHYIIFDLEWNQPVNYRVKKFNNKALSGEIIQMGAVKLDENSRYVDAINLVIKPQFYTELNEYVAEVTGVTRDMLGRGLDFPDAMQTFLAWCAEDFALATWGGSDLPILRENFEVHGLELDWLPVTYDIQQAFRAQHAEDISQACSLMAAAELLGIEQTWEAHDAFGDANYTAQIFQRLTFPQGISAYTQTYHEQVGEAKSYQFSKGANALSDAKFCRFSCSDCESVISISRKTWRLQSSNRYMAYVKCLCGSEYYLRARMKRNRIGQIVANRLIYRGNEELRSRYDAHSPKAIWQRKQKKPAPPVEQIAKKA